MIRKYIKLFNTLLLQKVFFLNFNYIFTIFVYKKGAKDNLQRLCPFIKLYNYSAIIQQLLNNHPAIIQQSFNNHPAIIQQLHTNPSAITQPSAVLSTNLEQPSRARMSRLAPPQKLCSILPSLHSKVRATPAHEDRVHRSI